MPKQTRTIIAVVVIAVFAALGIYSMVGTATPYVGFDDARTLNKRVQVMGKVDKASSNYDEKTGVFTFYIVDVETNDRMRVDYSGTKPGNFEQAESVVCIGKYHDGSFEANELLVKCPSKYQGQDYQEHLEAHGARI